MTERDFGWGGRRVAVIGQGTWGIDAPPRPQAVAALRAGLDAGLNHIDTAELYGAAEAIVGFEDLKAAGKILSWGSATSMWQNPSLWYR